MSDWMIEVHCSQQDFTHYTIIINPICGGYLEPVIVL